MRPRSDQIQMFYDGRCGWCRAGVRRLGRIDWLHALQPVDYNTLDPADRPVPEEQFARGMPLRTRSGRILVGFPAVRHAFIHTPAGWIVGWLMYIPGVSHLCSRMYDALARRRPGDAESASCRV